MRTNYAQQLLPLPLIRVITFGDFEIELLVSSPWGTEAIYERVAWEELHKYGTALGMLKALLCRPGRRASKQDLIETLWPEQDQIRATHALDVASSALRKRLVHTQTGESLLMTRRARNETSFRLPEQSILWVDADEFLTLITQARRHEEEGKNPIPLLEAALALAQGDFLEDDLISRWTQGRRQTIKGARSRALYKLVDYYIRELRYDVAEEKLFTHLEYFPTDEDALFQLVTLLLGQGRRHEARDIYRYVVDSLHEEQKEPSPFTQELIRKTHHGYAIREHKISYRARSSLILQKIHIHDSSKYRKGEHKTVFLRHPIGALIEHISHVLHWNFY